MQTRPLLTESMCVVVEGRHMCRVGRDRNLLVYIFFSVITIGIHWDSSIASATCQCLSPYKSKKVRDGVDIHGNSFCFRLWQKGSQESIDVQNGDGHSM